MTKTTKKTPACEVERSEEMLTCEAASGCLRIPTRRLIEQLTFCGHYGHTESYLVCELHDWDDVVTPPKTK